ncbi:rac GTPase-activating protein 1-like [Artemia franciscana]
MVDPYRLSLVAEFDGIIRDQDVLMQGCEEEFLRFVQSCKYLELDASKIRGENSRLLREKQDLSRRLDTETLKHEQSRSLLEKSLEKRRALEKLKNAAEEKLRILAEILVNDQNRFDPETREKLTFVQFKTDGRDGSPSRLDRLDPINELSSTASFLDDDISFDKTEEDLDFSAPRASRQGKRRKSGDKDESASKKRRSRSKTRKSRDRILESQDASHIVSVTTVSLPREGPVTATAQLEAMNAENRRRSKSEPRDVFKPTVPPLEDMYDSDSSRATLTRPYAPNFRRRASSNSTPTSTTPGFIRAMNSATKLNNRAHSFTTKTLFKNEVCTYCGKKMKFGTSVLKCNDCRASVHTDCKLKLPLPCISVATTPGKKNFTGVLADYVPECSPMVPALIVHCVNEVERRGLNEQGVYRVNGADSQVRELKEKFLKGKGVPNLKNYEIYTICSTIKSFLRDLRDTLITYTMWPRFVDAAETMDESDMQTMLYSCVANLPQPNRETLAYLMCHLHRVAESPACQMPIENLAMVFGQTIVGYSQPDPSQEQIISQTRKVKNVMEKLLTLPADYWAQFIVVDNADPVTPGYSTRGQRGSVTSTTDSAGGIRSFRRQQQQQYFSSPFLQ